MSEIVQMIESAAKECEPELSFLQRFSAYAFNLDYVSKVSDILEALMPLSYRAVQLSVDGYNIRVCKGIEVNGEKIRNDFILWKVVGQCGGAISPYVREEVREAFLALSDSVGRCRYLCGEVPFVPKGELTVYLPADRRYRLEYFSVFKVYKVSYRFESPWNLKLTTGAGDRQIDFSSGAFYINLPALSEAVVCLSREVRRIVDEAREENDKWMKAAADAAAPWLVAKSV